MTESNVICPKCKKPTFPRGHEVTTSLCWFCCFDRSFWTPEFWEACRPQKLEDPGVRDV